MDFSIKACDWNGAGGNAVVSGNTDAIVVGVFDGAPLTSAAAKLDGATRGLLSRLVASGDIDSKSGVTQVLREISGVGAARIVTVGLGKQESFGRKGYLEATRAAFRALAALPAARVVFTLAQEAATDTDTAWRVRSAITAARDGAYKFESMKSGIGSKDAADQSAGKAAKAAAKTAKAASKAAAKATTAIERGASSVSFTVDPADEAAAQTALQHGVALANGMDLTRDLGNLPPNVCTPTYLAEQARKLAAEWKIKTEVLGQKQMEALKMGSFLSVAKGSVEPPQFIVMQYRGGASGAAPVVLVGKGITFDSGGISLKPGEAMDEMKYDMCGAASVFGALRTIVEMRLPLNVVGVVPTCENMPAGNAVKPGDIVTSMSGRTIEILNTDAEGRLILCDALTYAERFQPAAVVDIATLTGACIIALGHLHSGLFSKDDALAEQLLSAARTASDTAWRLPLDDEYQDQLKSNFADVANIGGRPAGSVTAACFLSRFTEAYPWAHLDVAGTAWRSGAAKGATGRPVPLLVQFLVDRAAEGKTAAAPNAAGAVKAAKPRATTAKTAREAKVRA